MAGRLLRAIRAPAHTSSFAKASYFFYFAALGCLVPYLALYYRERGLSEGQIGLLLGIQPLIGLISSPIWGGVADATRLHKPLMALSIGGAMLSVFLLSVTSQFLWFIPVLVLFAACAPPVMALIDSTVLDMLGERRQDYGRLRVWGTIGWGLATLAVGVLADYLGLIWIFYAYIALMAGVLLAALPLPIHRASMSQPFWVGLRSLVLGWPWVVFMLTIMIEHMSAVASTSYIFLYMEDLGANRSLVGLASMLATVCEVPIFFFAPYLLRRWDARKLLLVSLGVYIIRTLAYTAVPSALLVLPIQLLHGFSFGLMWLAAVAYARDLAPEGLGATAQGALVAAMSLGGSLGNFIAGHLYHNLGSQAMFHWAAVGLLAGLLFFALAGRQRGAVAQLSSSQKSLRG